VGIVTTGQGFEVGPESLDQRGRQPQQPLLVRLRGVEHEGAVRFGEVLVNQQQAAGQVDVYCF
jgi:hypothetical protein